MSVRLGNNIIAGAGGGNVNNATITITQGGETKGFFTLNQAADETIALDVGGGGGAVDSVNGKTGVVILDASDVGALPDSTYIPTVNNSTITVTQGGVTKGTFTLNQANASTIALDAGAPGDYHPDLFDCKWADHICNDVQWLRADTFSWQSGAVYQVAYQHLTTDITGKTLQSETIGSTTVQFYLADDGHKICPASEESNVTAIYNATGVAWYYILDTANTRFKLPRTQFGFTGYRDAVGKYVEAGLPDHTHDLTSRLFRCEYRDIGTNCTYEFGSSTSQVDVGVTQGVSTNSVYGNSDTVQPKATEMYLYFYVGNFTQTALENTAGLNAELFNGKADLNLSNTASNIDFVVENQEPTAQNNYTWYRKYKSGWVEQGGIAEATYTGTTIALPIAMANTSYQAFCCNRTNTGTGNATVNTFAMPASTTTLTIGSGYSGLVSVSWQVSGMAA